MFRVPSILLLLFAMACGLAQSTDSAQQAGGSGVNHMRAPSLAGPTGTSNTSQTPRLHLTPIESVLAKSEVATGFADLGCDSDGNLYLGLDSPGAPAIRKLNSKGELVAVFQPFANPDINVLGTGEYDVTADGELYMWVGSRTEVTRYVLIFKADGSYKENIKLQPGFPWVPASIAVFPNGNLLMTGQEYVKDPAQPMLPFTAIFRSDGKLLKEINLEDDQRLQDLATARDPKVTSPYAPMSNRSVAWGRMAAAKDGNIYIMRWLSPAIFYAVSPGGEVVRRFTVDPGSPDFMPIQMHISGNRIAVLFRKPQTNEKIMKIVDLDGNDLSTYDELRDNGKAKLGPVGLAFACYHSNPEWFTFLTTDDTHRIKLTKVEAR
jgi:hypothetical protein